MSKKNIKKLSIITAGLILFAMVGFFGSLNVSQAEATTLIEGDVDLNGCVSIVDKELLNSYVAGTETLTSNQLECADTNDDSYVTAWDVSLLTSWLADPSVSLWQSPADDHMAKPVACDSITVTSPNGGEQWVEGNTYDITWGTKGFADGKALILSLVNDELNKTCRLIDGYVNAGDGKYSWKIGTDNCSIYYGNKLKIQIGESEGTEQPYISDKSDNYFSIVSETTCSVLQNQTSCLDNSNCYWDQQYDNCRTYDSTKQTCSDPDNGKAIYTQAHTYGFRESYANERDERIRTGGKDACIGDKLREHYCANDYYIRTYDVECPNGCENGACKRDETTCSDSDGGRDYYTKGTATLSSGVSKTDECQVYTVMNLPIGSGSHNIAEGMLTEYYCDENEIKSESFKCPNGCKDGACIRGDEPYCANIGTRSEGWVGDGISDIKWDNCDGCYAVCKAIGTKSEGWYSSCDGELIKYDSCGDSSILGYDKCGNGIGWSEPESAAKQCGWPVGSSGYIKDCCCCYTNSHIHDLGKVFENRQILIEYRPGLYEGCSDTMIVYSSVDGQNWNEVLSTNVKQETWSPKTTYKKTIKAENKFRYIKIYIPKCYNDYSSAKVIDKISVCLPDGTLIKLPHDPKIYVIKDCKKQWIKTLDEFNQEGYKWENVKETNLAVINAYADYLEAKANLLRSIGHHKVYRIINGKRLWIPTVAAFNDQGLKWENIQNVSNVTEYPRLKLAKLAHKPEVYYLDENGFKRHIPSAEVFNSYGNKWEDIVELSSSELNGYPDSALIRAKYKIYKLENGKKQWIKTAEAFNRLGYDWNKVSLVNDTEIGSYASRVNIE